MLNYWSNLSIFQRTRGICWAPGVYAGRGPLHMLVIQLKPTNSLQGLTICDTGMEPETPSAQAIVLKE